MAMLWTNDMVMGYIIQKFSLHTILWILHYSVFKEYDMLPNPQERNIRSLAQLFKKYLAKKKTLTSRRRQINFTVLQEKSQQQAENFGNL